MIVMQINLEQKELIRNLLLVTRIVTHEPKMNSLQSKISKN